MVARTQLVTVAAKMLCEDGVPCSQHRYDAGLVIAGLINAGYLRMNADLTELIEESSLGTPEAKGARASVTDEQARRAIDVADRIRSRGSRPDPGSADDALCAYRFPTGELCERAAGHSGDCTPNGDVLRTPEEWCRREHVEILDADGWRGINGRPWTDPITLTEFRERLVTCTQMFHKTDGGAVARGGGASPSARGDLETAAPSSPYPLDVLSKAFQDAEFGPLPASADGLALIARSNRGYHLAAVAMTALETAGYGLTQTDGGAAAPPADSPGVGAPAAAERATTTVAPPSDGAGAPPATAGPSPSPGRPGEAATGPVSLLIRQPRTFELYRHKDITGLSGTGVVVWGVQWPDDTVSIRWRGENPSFANWPNVESLLAVHGHDGATELRWLDGGA